MKSRHRRNHTTQDLHFLNDDGMVACNPRDREAAHRAGVEGIATGNPQAVTCKKCRAVIRNTGKLRPSRTSAVKIGNKPFTKKSTRAMEIGRCGFLQGLIALAPYYYHWRLKRNDNY